MKKPTSAKTVRHLSRGEMPSIVKVMGALASDPAARPHSRLKAIDVLLRVAATDHPAGDEAKAHLSRARSFLDQLIQSNLAHHTVKATRLAQQIADFTKD